MKRTRIVRSMIVVASDIHTDEVRNEFREYILEDLSGSSRTESVCEFDFAKCGIKWNKIVETISSIIDKRSDTVFLWDVDKPENHTTFEFFRTRIGK